VSGSDHRCDFPPFSIAFHPIVDAVARRVASWEALVRGIHGEGAPEVLGGVSPEQLHDFDERIRARAVALAGRLGSDCDLNLNFLPQGLIGSPARLWSTVEAAREAGFSPERIVLEISETEAIDDPIRFVESLNAFRSIGIKVAVDDFGAGYSGLNLLAEFQPDQVKLDMKLVRGINGHGPRQAIVRGICQTCADLAIDVVAEGVETIEEYAWLRGEGLGLFQGYLLARPGFECFPAVTFPGTA
jgi:EAL domain-containing protein (putative c-di-GMP-specific phosphodiesterase class I)